MKILHCCLANYFVDNFSYQENILTKIHKLQGYDVKIIASTETWIDNKKLGYIKANSYLTADNIPIIRIPYILFIPKYIARKLRIYVGLSKLLNEFKPEIIFLHDVQFVSVWEIAKYAKNNVVKIYADSHTDYMNSAKNWVSKNILHKIIYKWCTKKIEPYVTKFWGVTPSRKKFLSDFYGVDEKKVGLLVMGVDDSNINFNHLKNSSIEIRKELNINKNDFVIISGGKIVRRKNIHLLMQAINELNNPDVKLIIFGSISDEIKSEIEKLSSAPNIFNVGWKNSDEINELLYCADLAVFPGAHSVLWEQVVGLGLPAIFKYWEGYEHIDIGGNCIFLNNVTIEEIKNAICRVYDDRNLFESMKKVAIEKGINEFSYSKIAKRAIEMEKTK